MKFLNGCQGNNMGRTRDKCVDGKGTRNILKTEKMPAHRTGKVQKSERDKTIILAKEKNLQKKHNK
jgi:hypothetical protein